MAWRSLHVLQPFYNNSGDSGDDLAFICVSGSKSRQDKLSAIRQFDVSHVGPRGAGPTGFGPQTNPFPTFECDPRETGSLIIGIGALPAVIAFQELHHGLRALRVCDFAGYDFHQQTRGGLGSELVPILTIWSAGYAFATVSILAKCFLIDVDVCVAERGEITVNGVAFVLPFFHL